MESYNVVKGINNFYGYKKLETIKFNSEDEAKNHLSTLGVTEKRSAAGLPYYALVKQEGCAYSTLGFYC